MMAERPLQVRGLKARKGLGAMRTKAGWQHWSLILSRFRGKEVWEVVRGMDRPNHDKGVGFYAKGKEKP